MTNGNRRRSIVVLFSNQLMAAGLRQLMGSWRDSDVRYLSLRDAATMDRLLALQPDIVIVESKDRESWESKLLQALSRGLLVTINLDSNTLNCYYVRRDIPATVQELAEALSRWPDSYCPKRGAPSEASAGG